MLSTNSVYNGQPDYWWLRSPALDLDDYATVVGLAGNIDYHIGWNVTNSYGRSSPYTYPNYEYGFVVPSTGDVVNSYDSPVGFGSCGIFYQEKS